MPPPRGAPPEERYENFLQNFCKLSGKKALDQKSSRTENLKMCQYLLFFAEICRSSPLKVPLLARPGKRPRYTPSFPPNNEVSYRLHRHLKGGLKKFKIALRDLNFKRS